MSEQSKPNLGGLEGAKDQKSKKEIATSEQMQKRCEQTIEKEKYKNPVLGYLVKSMHDLGCKIPPSFIKCQPCEGADAGSYFDSKEGIIVCSNNLPFKSTLRASIIHELVHAYDHCRAKIENQNCYHLACTEIRASSLSGDCNYSQELMRGHWKDKIEKHHEECVKRRAVLSVKMHPSCSAPGVAEDAVQNTWTRCYNDYAPFDRIPR